MIPLFAWTTFDVSGLLPAGWRQDVRAVAATADFREFPRTPGLTREAPDVPSIYRGRVHAATVRDHLPWLHAGYRTDFLARAALACGEEVFPASDERYGVVLNVQRGTRMRFECHVDSNPLTGLLFFTDHQSGGELVVGHDPAAEGIAAVDQDCSVIPSRAGHLVFFDARRHPHYARPLAVSSDVRIAAVMNFYTVSCPESTRPRELNAHLYGDSLISGPT